MISKPPHSSRNEGTPPPTLVDTSNFSSGVLPSAFDAIGHTPLIHLQNLQAYHELECNLLAKVEFMSVGGSIKDRIAKAMLEKAESKLVRGRSVLVSATSGNTGIGLAMAGAIKGYRVIITLPEKMSLEKESTLRALGAEIVRTPNEKRWDEEGSHIEIAERLCKLLPDAVNLDQYTDGANPEAHYLTTWPEIAHSLSTSQYPSSTVSVFVSGAGTGGTIMGVSRGMKEAFFARNGCYDSSLEGRMADEEMEDRWRKGEGGVVVGVDPVGSVLAENGKGEVGMYAVEGIGYDFVPQVLKPHSESIHHWLKSNDDSSFDCVRTVHRLEGLLIGGSSGSALSSAIRWLKDPRPFPDGGWDRFGSKKGLNVVVLCADGVRNYMSKPWFLNEAAKSQKSDLMKEIDRVLEREEKVKTPEAGL